MDAAGGRTPWRNREFPVRMARVMGEAQLFRWLNLDGSVEFNPRSVYYDSESPFSGRERTYSLSATFQPNDRRCNQQVSFDRDTFDRLSEGGPRLRRQHHQLKHHLPVRPALLGAGDRPLRQLPEASPGRLPGACEFVPGTVAYAGYGALYERRGWDGDDWLPGQGSYLNTRRGFFFKLSYLYRF